MTTLTATHDTAATTAVERFYDAVRDGDATAALEVLHPDVVLHVPGGHPLAGDHHGPQSVLEFVVTSRGLTVDGEQVEVLDLLSGRTHVAALCHVSGERDDGRTLDNRTIHLMRIHSDGRIVEIWLHNWDQVDVDAFWSAS